MKESERKELENVWLGRLKRNREEASQIATALRDINAGKMSGKTVATDRIRIESAQWCVKDAVNAMCAAERFIAEAIQKKA